MFYFLFLILDSFNERMKHIKRPCCWYNFKWQENQYDTRNVFYKAACLEYTRNLNGSILFLSSYNYLKDKELPILYRAPLSSTLVWTLTYPIDSYKNLLLSNQGKEIISVKRLYKGIQYPIIRAIPSSNIGFYVYEYMLDYMNKTI